MSVNIYTDSQGPDLERCQIIPLIVQEVPDVASAVCDGCKCAKGKGYQNKHPAITIATRICWLDMSVQEFSVGVMP